MAGGFMSGFGTSFAKTYSAGVQKYQDEQQDLFKTRLKYGLDQKAALDKASAEDKKTIADAKGIVSGIAGLPDDAWKQAAEYLRIGYKASEVEDKLRKGTFSPIDQADKADEVVAPTQEAKAAPVDAQMQEAMGEPTPQVEQPVEVAKDVPEEAPKEEGGIFSSLREAVKGGKERREKRADDKVRETMGLSEDEYAQVLNGYTPTDLSDRSFKFTVAGDDSEAKNFSTYLYNLAKKDPRLIEAEKNGDLATAKRIMNEYQKQGETTLTTYDWKGTKASLLDLKDDAERNAQSDDPNVSGPAKQFLEARLPQILAENPDILDDSGSSTTDPDERLAMNVEALLEAKNKLKTVSPEKLPALQAEIADLESKVEVGERTKMYMDRLGKAPGKRQVWVRDEESGANRLIEATIVRDLDAPNGERLTDGAGNPISFIRDASERDKTIIAGFKSVSDERAKFNTETVSNAAGALLTGKRISDSLRGEYGLSLVNATGGLANIYQSAVNNLKVLGNSAGILYKGETERRYNADEFASTYGFDSFEAMANARDDFNANAAVLVYQLASSLFDQTGRGLSDTDLIKTGEAIGVENFNDPIALANRIDQLMVDHMDKINAKGRDLMALPEVQAYQEMMGMEEVPMEARTRTLQDSAKANPGTSASAAIEYYTSIAPKVREGRGAAEEPPKDSEPFELSTDLSGLTEQEKVLAQTLLDRGITKVKRVAGRLVPVVE